MGLLDDFDSMPDDRKSAVRQGLLTMGLNMLAGGGTFGQQVGRGGLAGLGGYQDALQQAQAQKSKDMLQQMQALQLQQAQRGAARQQQLDALPGQFSVSPAQQALAAGGGPTLDNAQRMGGMAPQFDAEGYGKALMGVDPQAGVAFQQSIAKQRPTPIAVSPGQSLVDPTTGKPLFAAAQNPLTVSEGQTVLDPTTRRPMFTAPKSPIALGENQSLVSPSGKVVYSPAKDDTPDTDIESQAQAIASARAPAFTGVAALRPDSTRIMQRVLQINPNYDASLYPARIKAQKDFTTGPLGNSMRSVATANVHLDQLGDLATEMQKNSIPGVNRIINWYETQTGDPGVTNFNSIKNIVGQEVVKAIVAGGGGVAEREDAARAFSDASSPAQIAGVIQHYRNVMNAQHESLLSQRRAAGLTDDTLPDYTGAKSAAIARAQSIQNAKNAIFRGGDKAGIIAKLEAAGITDHGIR